MTNRITASARFALAAVKGYRKAKKVTAAQVRNTHIDDQAAELSDLMADVLHLADQRGFDCAALHRMALTNFESERDNLKRGILEGATPAELDAYINS